MKPCWIAIASLAAASSTAAADPARCEKGLELAGNQDLPRAALYLEHCDEASLDANTADKVRRARADVTHKLDGSKLSALSIVTTPEGLVAETDAMPGERFTTPATIWTKAGDYKINVALDTATLDAGKGLTTTASLDAFSRRTVIINIPTKQAAPKTAKLDFSDDTAEQTAHSGPPPNVKHGTMLPKKYLRPPGGGGPQLDDPFELRGDSGQLAWRLGARIGGGLYLHDTTSSGATFSVAGLAKRQLAGPVSLATRVGWAHRDIDAVGLDVGIGFELARSTSLQLTAGAALRGEVRVQDELAMQPVARVGVGGALQLELALAAVPLAIGLRVEPSFTELVPGSRNHNVLVELGYDFR